MDPETVKKSFLRLVDMIRTLRGPDGCPWDRAQTTGSVFPYLMEEAYEALDAFERSDGGDLKGELGDLLFQLLFIALLEEEAGRFRLEDVLETVIEKMTRRHPHVFGDQHVSDVSQVVETWHRIKQEERDEKQTGPLDSIPRNLPALMYAQRVGERASKVGFDWEDLEGVLDKAREEWEELRQAIAREGAAHPGVREEMGDLLFTLVNACRFLDVPAEFVLRNAVRKFVRRFGHVLDEIENSGDAEVSPSRMDALWEQRKQAERRFPSEDPNVLVRVEQRLGHRFSRPDLLRQALCHDSYANEHPDEFPSSNERLEFLGDAVLSLLVTSRLYHHHPDAEEGQLTRMRAVLVNTHSLASAAQAVELDKAILLGRGEETTGGREKESILADGLEAVLGAVYLDGGLEAVDAVVERVLGEDMRSGNLMDRAPDYKSAFQEVSYALFKLHPEYQLLREEGPDHEKLFWVETLLDGRSVAVGKGRTKKDAAQEAARTAMERIEAGWRP